MPARNRPLVIGSYDDRGNACVGFRIHGVKHSPPGPKYTGIVDTGFTRFLQIPLIHAFALGLPLEGTITLTLADSSQATCLTALAQVTLNGTTLVGIVVLSPTSEDILLGMEFLRRFQRALVVGRDRIFLIEEESLSDTSEPQTPEPRST